MATLIASMAASGITPKACHTGLNTVVSTYSLTASLATNDIIQFLKLPDGARVIHMEIMSNVNLFAMAGIVDVGTRADQDLFIQSATPSANLKFTVNVATGFGYELDMSDTDEPKYSMVEMKVTIGGTGTTSGAISLLVCYDMNQP